jgi:hypothetical protein
MEYVLTRDFSDILIGTEEVQANGAVLGKRSQRTSLGCFFLFEQQELHGHARGRGLVGESAGELID